MPRQKVTSNKTQQGHQSTKNTVKPDDPEQEPNNEKTHEVYIEMEEIEEKNYSDHKR